MAVYNIYHKDGSQLKDSNGKGITVHSIEYNGTWMGECFVTVTFENEAPISFSIGDYIEYRGERFEINYDPGKIKCASKDSYGGAFKYESVKFNALSDELVRCDMLDLVLYDNQLHYTALPLFSFYVESLDDLLDRIQANLDELYGKASWKLYSRNKERSVQRGGLESEWNSIYGEGTADNVIDSTSIQISDQNCWEALSLVNSRFDINFIIRNRNVYVGTAGMPTTNIFKYGKGEGLYKIEQNSESDQMIVTRLRAYGSNKNLPNHYYADLGGIPFLNITGDYHEGSTDNGLSVMMEDSTYAGMFTDIIYENGTLKHCRIRGSIDGYIFSGELELVKKDATKSTTRLLAEGKEVCDAIKAKIDSGIVEVDFLSGANKAKFDGNRINYVSNLPNNMACDRLMLPGFPNKTLKEWWDAQSSAKKAWLNPSGKEHIFSNDIYRPYVDSLNIERIGVRPSSVFFDQDDKVNGIVEIYPTIEEMEVDGVRIDEIYTGTNIEDDGRFGDGETVANVDIYLSPKINFDIRGLMQDDFTIHMKDGMCAGREFKIAGCTKQNDGSWRLTIERQPDDSLNLYFPYNDFQIKKGDHFVLSGIELPDAYVEAASEKLLKYCIAYLDKNDYTRYVYQPKVDEIFMARQHDMAMADASGLTKSLYLTLKEGDIMLFKDDDLGIDAEVTIDQLTIKENDGKIPTYEITLREEKEVGTIQKIQNQISSITNGNGGSLSGAAGGGLSTSQIKNLINSVGSDRFLSKLNPDTAAGIITFLQGTNWGNFTSETGAAMTVDPTTGQTYMEVDRLKVRLKAFFEQLEVQKVGYVGGKIVVSKGQGVDILDVEEIYDSEGNLSAYRCYFLGEQEGRRINNLLRVNDQMICKDENISEGSTDGASNKYYWRLATAVSSDVVKRGNNVCHWVDLSAIDCDTNSDIPEIGDTICHLGNREDTDRQGAEILSVVDANSPSFTIYSGINSYSLVDKEYIDMGVAGGKAFCNIYGSTYIGDRERKTGYLRWNDDTKTFEIKGTIDISSPLSSGGTIGGAIDNAANAYKDDFSSFTSNVNEIIGGFQAQIDGVIETWFYDPAPTLGNLPASEWKDNTTKDKHLGDLYYSKAGKAYRFQKEGDNYVWVEIMDTDITKALEEAKAAKDAAAAAQGTADTAQDTANSKMKVFVVQPTSNDEYSVGDMWVNATYPADGSTYNNEILHCVTKKAAGEAFSISHWAQSSNIKTQFNNFVNNTYAEDKKDFYNQLDGKVETWYQKDDPKDKWAAADYSKHKGDIWYNDTTNKSYRWTGTAWVELKDQAAIDAKALAESKRRVFTTTTLPTPPYDARDLWVQGENGDIMVCVTPKAAGTTASASDWAKASKYTDDSALNTFINEYKAQIADFSHQLDGKIETWYYPYVPETSNAPADGWTADEKTSHSGDLFYNTATGVAYRWTGTAWEILKDKEVQTALNNAKTAQDTADNKRRVFLSQPTVPYDAGDLWVSDTANGKVTKVCVNGKTTGTFSTEDWKESDDAALNTFSSTITESIKGIESQLDKKAETWYQPEDPSTAWTTAELKKEHVGDLWYNTTYNTTWYYNGTKWVQQNVPTVVFDKIDGKAAIYVSKPKTYRVNDLWILEAAYTLSGVSYTKGTLVVATATSNTFNAAHWTEKVKYTDDTKAKEALTKVGDLQTDVTELGESFNTLTNTTLPALSDGIITTSEKENIRQALMQVQKECVDVINAYTNLTVNYKSIYDKIAANVRTDFATAYTNLMGSATLSSDGTITYTSGQGGAYGALVDNINALLNNEGNLTTNEIATINNNIANFNIKYNDFQNRLVVVRNDIEKTLDTRITDVDEQLGGYAYLKKIVGGKTTIDGGLVLTTTLGTGYEVTGGAYKIMSGISGLYETAKSVAIWAGGSMIDKFVYYDAESGKFNVPADVNPANFLVRMDGTGYAAGGNFWWDNDGKIHADPQSFLINEQYVGNVMQLFQLHYREAGKTEFTNVDYVTPTRMFNGLELSDKGLQIGDTAKLYIKNGVLFIEGDLAVTGGITMYASDGVKSGMIDQVYAVLDQSIFSIKDGVITITGEIGSGTVKGITINSTKYDPDTNGIIALTLNWGDLTGVPTTFTPSAHTHDDRYYTESEIDTKLGLKLDTSLKGAANGLATLDASGKVPSAQLPSYVDDVLEYTNKASFPATGESGKIYIDQTTNLTYRWGGSAYVEISQSLALGETSSTAYAGDKGKQNAADIAALKTGKADKATTLSGYGITDAYTKTEVNTKLTDGSVTKIGTKDVGSATLPIYLKAGVPTACNTTLGVSITGNSATATKLANARTLWGQSFDGSANVSGNMTGVGTITPSGNDLKVVGNLIVTGGIVMYADDGATIESGFAALLAAHIDGVTIKYNEAQQKIYSVMTGIKVNGATYKPSETDGYITIPDYPTSLDWENIENKPSTFTPASHTHTFASLTSKPTTLGGYGITDAKIANGVITLGTATITPLTTHQTVTLASGTNNGTLKLTVNGTATDNIAVKGLGSAAYTNSSAYAAASHTHSQYLVAASLDGYVNALTDNTSTNVFVTAISKSGKTLSYTKSFTKKSLTAASHSGWSSADTDKLIIPDMSFIAYWNGAYNSNGSSNLAYCNKGAFGDMATASKSSYYTKTEVNTKLGDGSVTKLGTGTTGAANTPIYWSNGKPAAVTLVDTANNLINSLTTGTSTPVDADYYVAQYVGGGTTTITFHRRPHSALYAYIKGKAEGTWAISISGNAATASKLGTANVGSGTQHFYLNAGTATASTSTVGGTAKPMYLNAGVMTAISDTVGGTAKPIFLNAGTLTAISATVGSASKPVYLSGGSITACSYDFTSYLPLAGGTMAAGARISHADGNMYIGRSDNNGWVMCQNLCSQDAAGDTYWSLRNNGTFHSKVAVVSGNTSVGSLTINGINVTKSSDGILKIDGNLIVTGGITMYATDGVASGLMEQILVDGVTIDKDANGRLYAINTGNVRSIVMGSTTYTPNSSGVVTLPEKVTWANIEGKPSTFTPSAHTHSDYVTALGTNGNYLTWTKNGSTSNITVPFATTATSAVTSNRTKFLETFQSGSTTETFGSSYPIWAQWANATNVRLKCTNYTVWIDKADYATSAGAVAWSNVTGKPYSSFGTASQYNSVGIFGSPQHSDYPNNQDQIITRSFMSYWNGACNSGGASNLHYCEYGIILGTNNYYSYALPLSGGTMSNTNVVTNLNADLLDGNHASAFAAASHTHSYLNAICSGTSIGGESGAWSKIESTTDPLKFKVYEVYDDGGPTSYGEVLNVTGNYNHWQAQLWMGSGKGGRLYYRNKNYNDNTWGDWGTVAFTADNVASANYASSAGNADTLDGNHASAFATAGHNHFDRLSSVNIDTGLSHTLNRHYEINNATGTLPFSSSWHQVYVMGSGDPGYTTQICTGYVENTPLYFRHKLDGSWRGWRTILDSVNYSSYALPLSGGTISGNLAATGKVTFLNEAKLKMWNVTSTRNSDYGAEMVFVQTSIDGADPETKWPDKNRNDLFLQPKGGHVHIGPIETAQNYTCYVAGTLRATDTITAPTFSGALSGNAATASKWATARTITLTGSVTGSVSIDGSGNVTLETTTNHTHAYLPLAGGTMTGTINANDNVQNTGIKFKSNNANLNALSNQHLILGTAIRFGDYNTWDWNVWAGLKYDHATKTIYLGISDGTVFNANTAQTGGTLSLPAISTVEMDADARISYNPEGNLYIGNSSNNGWVYVQDMASQSGVGYWRITQTGYLTAKGVTLSEKFNSSVSSSTYLAANRGTAIINSTAAAGFNMLARMKSTNGVFIHGVYYNAYKFYYTGDGVISEGANEVSDSLLSLGEDGYVMSNHLVPLNNAACTFGLSSNRWLNGYFSNKLYVGAANSTVANAAANCSEFGAGYIELSHSTPFIDFHYGNSTGDYTSRIVATSASCLAVTSNLYIGGAGDTSYKLCVAGQTHIDGALESQGTFVVLGSAGPVAKIDQSGNITANGGITMYSDLRKKNILSDRLLSVKSIADAPLFAFNYKSDEAKRLHTGTSAQYWHGAYGDMFGYKDEEGFYTLEYQNLGVAMGISLAREIVTFEGAFKKYESKTDKKIRLMKKKINDLEARIKELEGSREERRTA